MSNVAVYDSAEKQAMSAWVSWVVVVIEVDTTMTATAVAKEP